MRRSFTTKTRLVNGSDEHVDGCATFFKEELFSLEGEMDVHFNDLAEGMYHRGEITQVGARARSVRARRSISG